VLEDQIVDLIIVAMERSEEMLDDGDAGDDDGYNTNCLQLWQHLSSQLIFFVLFQLSSFPHIVNALYEKVSTPCPKISNTPTDKLVYKKV